MEKILLLGKNKNPERIRFKKRSLEDMRNDFISNSKDKKLDDKKNNFKKYGQKGYGR